MGRSQELNVPKSGNDQPLHPVFTDIKTQLRLQLDAMQNIQDYLKTLTNAVQDLIQYSRLQSKTPELLEEIETLLKNGKLQSSQSNQSNQSNQPTSQPKPKAKPQPTQNSTTTNTTTNTKTKTNTNGDKETQVIEGTIEAATKKALLLTLLNGQEFWVPRSTIHNNYNDAMQDQKQRFNIEVWILKKNGVI